MSAHRQTMRQAGQAHATGLHEFCQIEDRGITFHSGIGSADNLPHIPLGHPFQERIDFQLLRANTVKGREGSHKDVIQPFVGRSTLDEEHIARIFHDTDETSVTRRIDASGTRIYFGNAATLRTKDDLFLHVHKRARQPLGTYLGCTQDKKGKSLRRFLPNARQAAEFLYEIIECTWSRHGNKALSRGLERQTGYFQATRELAHLLGHHLLRFPQRFVYPGNDEIFKHLNIIGVDDLRLNFDAEHFALAIHCHSEHTATDRSIERLFGNLFLQLHHFLLHLLGLLHQIAHSTSHDYLLK